MTIVEPGPPSVEDVERRLVAAFADVRDTVVEHPDLFARVERTIEQDAARRRFRLRLVAAVAAFVLVNASLALALSNVEDGRIVMPWWVVELITNLVLVAIAIALGPFIKRFGRAYAADVFRAKVIDTTTSSFVFELTGDPGKIDRFVALMRELGLVEVGRTGVVGMMRGAEAA